MAKDEFNREGEGGTRDLLALIRKVWKEWGISESLGKNSSAAKNQKQSAGRKKGANPNIRLIRDYMNRKIMTKPHRQGREAVYSARHVIEFIAARRMLDDEWPLSQIAGAMQSLSPEELSDFARGDKIMSQQMEARRDALLLSGVKEAPEVRMKATALGWPENEPLTEQVTLIVVKTWCQLLIESRRLQHVTDEEAKEIGRTVEARLMDERIRKRALGRR